MKKISLYLVIIFTFLSFFGCNSKNNQNNNLFIEKECSLPELKRIFDIQTLDNNKIILIGVDSNENFKEYISNDGGENWIEKESSLLKNDYIYNVATNKFEDFVALYSSEKNSNNSDFDNMKNILLKKGKDPINLDISNEEASKIGKFKITSNGDLLYWFNGDKIVQYDSENGKIKNTYTINNGEIIDFCSISNNLVVITTETAIQYDLNTGKEIRKMKELSKYIEGSTQVYCGNGDNEIYLTNLRGLYKYDMSSKSINEIFDSSTYLLSDKEKGIIGFVKVNDNEFLILYTSYNQDISYNLCKYSFSNELVKNQTKELKVYSLYNDELIKRIISKYQRNNNEVRISYEVGITDDNNITKSDALNILNTDIMAGNGPDILILDNILVDSYLEKGILENISDIIEEKKSNLFSGIVNSYYDNQKIYMCPLRVEIPIIMGEHEIIDKINNLASLTEVVENDLKNESNKILDIYNIFDLVNLLYYTSSNKLIDDKKLNEDYLREFLEKVNKIYSVSKSKVSSVYLKAHNEQEQEYIKTQGDKYLFSESLYLEKQIDPIGFLIKNSVLDIGYINSFSNVSQISTVIKENSQLEYKLWSSDGENTFLPKELMAINTKGKNKEVAKEFLSQLLNEEYQEFSENNGLFPINRNAFSNLYKKNIGNNNLGGFGIEVNGKIKEYNNVWPTEKEFNTLLEIIEGVNTHSKLDKDILLAIMKASENYTLGKYTLDEAVKYISNELDIYLSE